MFNVSVKLAAASNIRLSLYSLAQNLTVSDKVFTGNKEYTIPYQLNVSKGVYVMILETPRGSAIYKVLIN